MSISRDSEEEQEADGCGLSYLAAGDPPIMTLTAVAVVVPTASISSHQSVNQALLTRHCRPITACQLTAEPGNFALAIVDVFML